MKTNKTSSINVYAISVMVGLISMVIVLASPQHAVAQKPPFGTEKDVSYSKTLWSALEKWNLVGAGSIKAVPYPGQSPHGAVLESISTRIKVNNHTGEAHVKTNYGGSDITPAKVANNRAKYIASITVMFQREAGYDPDNKNWFWAKYTPDGGLEKNPKGMPLAGRVAKGMAQGCIACHQNAKGGDYLFNNDPSSD